MSEFTHNFSDDEQNMRDVLNARRRIDPSGFTSDLIHHSLQRIEQVTAGDAEEYDPQRSDNDHVYRSPEVFESLHILNECYADAIEAVRKLTVAERNLRAAQKDADRAVGRMFIDARKTLTSDTLTAADFELSAKPIDEE
ncbi:hypothetical protein EON76_00965 [bacterium]|nr:MAG: hypothetical protein EON76_00965 [bacterium]